MNASTVDIAPLPLRAAGVDDFTGQWWVAQTRPQYERMLARDLSRLQVDYYLPLVQIRRTRPKQGKTIAVVPLFPMYVFVNGESDARYEAARSPYTSRMIDVRQQRELSVELSAIERAIAIEPCLCAFSEFARGDRCVVRPGHRMEGTEGILLRRDDHRQVFVLQIKMLGQSTCLEIGPEWLDRI